MTLFTRRIISLSLLGHIFLLSHVYAYKAFQTQYYYHPRTRFITTQKNIPKTPTSWNGYLSAKQFSSSKIDQSKLLSVRNTIRSSVEQLPQSHIDTLQKLEVQNQKHASRGLANSKKLILNIGNIQTNDEMTAVFTHEMGHIVDLGLLKGQNGQRTNFIDRKNPVLSDDPSVQFYSISWLSSNQTKPQTQRSDFVSGYAMSNPFEDFAESYLFYRYHGDKFRLLAQKSNHLQKKYAFIKTVVFEGKEYQLDTTYTQYVNNAWDVTLLSLPSQPLLTAAR